ncbi:carboxylesterase/lipase family protein [Geodermatophilus sp. SYSU D00742]
MNPLIVPTTSGAVRGLEQNGVRSWRGIPYAAAPTGLRRWAPPQPPAPWTGTRDATEFGPRAPQAVPAELVPPGGDIETDDGTSFEEDCLRVNVCAPADPPTGVGLPVLVWVHGGGFHFGSGANVIGDGATLADSGIVVVTFNYRLGALGFLDLAGALGPAYASSGNCGLLDQIAALRWVRANIAGFGGDPQRVTIAGVSAGAKSVLALMASPAARGLFARAISQSGGDHVIHRPESTTLTNRLLRLLDIDEPTPERLAAVPTSDVLAAQWAISSGVRATWTWRPLVDGTVLPSTPTQALAGGAARGIDLIAGTTLNEASGYDLAVPTAADQVDRVLEEIFGPRTHQVLAAYAESMPGASDREVRRAVMTDERYAVPTRRVLDAQSRHARVWSYRFDAPSPGLPQERWALHGADVPLIWDVGLDGADADVRALAAAMRETWLRFIHGADPGSAALPAWPAYRADRRATVHFDLPLWVEDDAGGPAELWDDAQWVPGTWWPLDEELVAG